MCSHTDKQNSCKCHSVTKTKVKNFLKKNNKKSGAPFSVCNYGNAFTDKEIFAGEGNGRNNTRVNSSMYFRFASMTKMLGMIVLAAAMEDKYISSLDDSVGKYIDEFNGTGYYMNPNVTSNGNFDDYGSPIYTSQYSGSRSPIYDLNNCIPFELETITIRHLVTMTAGFGYSFLQTGTLRTLLNSMPNPPVDNTVCNRNVFMSWLQYIEANKSNGYADTIDSFYQSAPNSNFKETFTTSIKNRIKNIPFLFLPGSQYLYDISPTIMGAVVGAALQKVGKKITSVQYLQNRILSPLGINSFWFNCGSSQPPKDVKSKITDAYFVRNNTYQQSDNNSLYINTTGQGNNVQINTLYRCSNSLTIGDGFTNQTNNSFFQKLVGLKKGDNLAGGYDWSGCGTLPDFCKLLKFLILKGKNAQGQQILKSQTIEWILIPKVPENQALWLYGNDTFNFSYESSTWCGAFNKFMSNQPSLPFPCGPNTYAKQSYFGMHYFFDTETGNYMISGTQSPGSSWYIQKPTIDTLPYGTSHTPNYEPDELTLWKLTTT